MQQVYWRSIYSLGVNDVLRQVAAIADEENQYGPMVSRPHSARKKAVCGTMSRDVHVGNFGSPMWEAHALACTLILDPNRPLTPDDLRAMHCRWGGRKAGNCKNLPFAVTHLSQTMAKPFH